MAQEPGSVLREEVSIGVVVKGSQSASLGMGYGEGKGRSMEDCASISTWERDSGFLVGTARLGIGLGVGLDGGVEVALEGADGVCGAHVGLLY